MLRSKFFAAVGLVLALSFGSGCVTTSTFTKSGLPSKQFVVGSGFVIEYYASSDGTALWVEGNTNRILKTESLRKDDMVTYDVEDFRDLIEEKLGISIKDAVLTLYFVPED
ncbi:hypothetical protein KAW08_00075 [bacterium]|nr:hypothetical protein [bacterium]